MRSIKIISIVLIGVFAITACKKDSFVNANIDPNVLYGVDPADQILAAATKTQNDFEYFYDVYRDLMPWMQYSTSGQGNGLNFTGVGDHFNYRYGNFYTQVGAYLSERPDRRNR